MALRLLYWTTVPAYGQSAELDTRWPCCASPPVVSNTGLPWDQQRFEIRGDGETIKIGAECPTDQ